jgi:replicative DNA helicase
LASDNVTVSEIKNKIRKMNSDGTKKVDLLVIDYVDCISSKSGDEEWKGEGAIMRALETMASEFEFALWTAVQGSRSAISSEIVTTDQMGGSIKKAQIAHVIISVGKTLEQKEHNLATMTILKSRIGKDGIIFQNCKYDNEFLIIDTETQNTLLGVEQDKEVDKTKRLRDAYDRQQQNK